jgi:hypothetical protein
MGDFNEITTRIFTGAAVSTLDDVNQLVAAGVTVVLDARAEFDDGTLFAGHPAISYKWNPTQDDGQTKTPGYFATTLNFVLPMLAQPHNKAYLHCAAGVNRGPSNALCVMLALGWDFDTAVALMHAKRPIVNIAYAKDAQAAVNALGYV